MTCDRCGRGTRITNNTAGASQTYERIQEPRERAYLFLSLLFHRAVVHQVEQAQVLERDRPIAVRVELIVRLVHERLPLLAPMGSRRVRSGRDRLLCVPRRHEPPKVVIDRPGEVTPVARDVLGCDRRAALPCWVVGDHGIWGTFERVGEFECGAE